MNQKSLDKQGWEKKLEKFIELGKELGFTCIDLYSPDKKEVVAITFSTSKKYIQSLLKGEK